MNQRKSPYTGTRASVYGDFSVLCKKSVSLLPRGRFCFFWGHICILHFVCGLSSVRSHVGSGLVFPGKIILPTRHLRQRWRRRSGREILSVSPRRSQSMGLVLHALTQRAAVLGSSMAKPPKTQGYVVTIGWFSVKVNRDRAPGFTTFAGVWYHADRNKSANEGGRLCQTPEKHRRHSRQKNA